MRSTTAPAPAWGGVLQTLPPCSRHAPAAAEPAAVCEARSGAQTGFLTNHNDRGGEYLRRVPGVSQRSQSHRLRRCICKQQFVPSVSHASHRVVAIINTAASAARLKSDALDKRSTRQDPDVDILWCMQCSPSSGSTCPGISHRAKQSALCVLSFFCCRGGVRFARPNAGPCCIGRGSGRHGMHGANDCNGDVGSSSARF